LTCCGIYASPLTSLGSTIMWINDFEQVVDLDEKLVVIETYS
jgi:hypothetical protein